MAKKSEPQTTPLVDDPAGVALAHSYAEEILLRLPTFSAKGYHEVEGGSASDLVDWSQSRAKGKLVRLWELACNWQKFHLGVGAKPKANRPTHAAIMQAHYGAMTQFAGTRWQMNVQTYTAEALCAIGHADWREVALDAVRSSWRTSPPVDILGELLASGDKDPLTTAGIA